MKWIYLPAVALLALLCAPGALWASTTFFYHELNQFGSRRPGGLPEPEFFFLSGVGLVIAWSLLCSVASLPAGILGKSISRTIVALGAISAIIVLYTVHMPRRAFPLTSWMFTATIAEGPEALKRIPFESSAGGAYDQMRRACGARADAVCINAAASRAEAIGARVSQQWLLLLALVYSTMIAVALLAGRIADSMGPRRHRRSENVAR